MDALQSDVLQWVQIVIGLGIIGAAVFTYLRVQKLAFPLSLALLGVFLMVADEVSANLPGGAGFRIARDLANQSADTAEATQVATKKNSEAIGAINDAFGEYQTAFSQYQDEVNERFAALDGEPLPVFTYDFAPLQLQVQEQLQEATRANEAAAVESTQLRNLADRVRVSE